MNERTTSIKAAAAYILASGAFLLGIMLLVGCTTPTPPDPGDLQFPPVKYGVKPPIPQSPPRFNWRVGDYSPATAVRIEWDYPESNRAGMVFRVYGSDRPTWATNWEGWTFLGETPDLEWRQSIWTMREFYTVTASNTLLCLESDPARRE